MTNRVVQIIFISLNFETFENLCSEVHTKYHYFRNYGRKQTQVLYKLPYKHVQK